MSIAYTKENMKANAYAAKLENLRFKMKEVYCDIEPIRELWFRSTLPLSPAEAESIMKSALAPWGDYNEFIPDLLRLLPADSRIILAREYSVCVYVEGEVAPIPAMKYDEWRYDPETNETRIWWD